MKLTGTVLGDRPIKYVFNIRSQITMSNYLLLYVYRVNYSKNAINKGPRKIDEAIMRKVRAAELRITGKSTSSELVTQVETENGAIPSSATTASPGTRVSNT